MCCLFTALVLIGPRFAILVWWLVDSLRFSAAFNSFIWSLVGAIFLPWTTLTYLIVWSPDTGISGLKWVFLGLAVVGDIILHAGGGYGNRNRVSRYYR
jgi:hypothetical protein